MSTLIPEQLRAIADQIQAGIAAEPVTVRTLLSWFGAERRGYFVVEKIRGALALLDLGTAPDFGSVWLDTPVTIRGVAASGRLAPSEGGPGPAVDGQYRIGQLEAANRGVVRVEPEDTVARAVTIMLARDFSQLPVMTGEREVEGVVTWASIGARQALGLRCDRVLDCIEPHCETSADASLFSAIPAITERQYVLVRDPKDGRITGIVTASDLAHQFQQVAEPLALIGRIEQHLRRLIENRFTEIELAAAKDPADIERKVTSAADLTLHECARLIEPDQRWRKLGLRVDRAAFVGELNTILVIRNDLMHFDPDPPTAEELAALRTFARFMEFLSSAVGGGLQPARGFSPA